MKTTKLLGIVALATLCSISTTFACVNVDYSKIKEGDPVPNNACAQTQKTYSTQEAFEKAEWKTCETATDGCNTFFVNNGKVWGGTLMYCEDQKEEWSCLDGEKETDISDNDKNLKLHIENTLDTKYITLVQDVLKKYTKRLEKFSDAKKTEINNKIIEKVNIKIDDFLMKYPQDVALPKSANNIYLTLEYLQLSLAELNFGENTKTPVGLANPASEFCIKQGGTLEIKDEKNGQTGYCKLKNGTVVEEWEYFKRHNKNTENSKTYKNDEPFTNIEGEKVEKVTLKVEGNKVYMNGTIATDTPKLFKKVFAENPQIDTLEMLEVPGSLDDEANLEIAKWIAKKGLTFILGKNGDIASGGTDFFLAGKTRIVHKWAKVGVHSWSEGEDGKTAKDYPRDSKVHQSYIDYYQTIGWNEADSKKFYYFTIDSATAHGMHSMTEQEIIDYRITTEGKIR